MIHIVLTILLFSIAAPLTLFGMAFLVAFGDFLHSQLFPSRLPELLDDLY